MTRKGEREPENLRAGNAVVNPKRVVLVLYADLRFRAGKRVR